MSAADSDELQLEENEDDELVLEDNADDAGPLLEDNAADSDSDGGLVLEHNVGSPCGPELEDEEDEVALEENEAAGCLAGGVKAAAAAERAEALRVEGNSHFRAGRMDAARTIYTAALAASPPSDNAASATILTNRAAASLKLSDWTAVINDCTAALTLTAIAPESRRKALFRRAAAFVYAGDFASARRDLAELPAGDPAVSRLRREMGDAAPASGSSSPNGGGSGEAGSSGSTGRCGGGSLGGGGGSASRALSSSGAGAGAGCLVSCIAPTTPERHVFHDCTLYRCFATQTHPAIELIVVDTGASPSPFFTTPGSPGCTDPRVKYIHQLAHMTIGEKRNVAIANATGEFICHFDDDDLYAPMYVETMLASLLQKNADFVKLSAWYIHDLQTGATGHFDAEAGMPHLALAQLTEQFLYTYGFSFLYRRGLFPAFSFAATSWGEDQDILMRVRDAGRTVALHRDVSGICLHNQHGENCSRSFAQTSISLAQLRASPLSPLLPALPTIAAALAGGRTVEGEQGVYGAARVVSRNAGGLFCWDKMIEANNGDGDATLQAFTEWLWSGNGFSKSRYDKLGLARPSPPPGYLSAGGGGAPDQLGATDAGAAAAAAALRVGAGQGLESLRLAEGMGRSHAPGAITNPPSYRPGAIGNPQALAGGAAQDASGGLPPPLRFGQPASKFQL